MPKGRLELGKTAQVGRLAEMARQGQLPLYDTPPAEPFGGVMPEAPPAEPFLPPMEPEEPEGPEGAFYPRGPESLRGKPTVPGETTFPEGMVPTPSLDLGLAQRRAVEQLEREAALDIASAPETDRPAPLQEIPQLKYEEGYFELWQEQNAHMVQPNIGLGRSRKSEAFDEWGRSGAFETPVEVPLWTLISPLTSWDRKSLSVFFPEMSFELRTALSSRSFYWRSPDGGRTSSKGPPGYDSWKDQYDALSDVYAKNPSLRGHHLHLAYRFREDLFNHLTNHPEEPNAALGWEPGDTKASKIVKARQAKDIIEELRNQLPWLKNQIEQIPGVGGEVIEVRDEKGSWRGGEIVRQEFSADVSVEDIAKRSIIRHLEEPKLEKAASVVKRQKELKDILESLAKSQTTLQKQIDEKRKGRFGVLDRPEFLDNEDALSGFLKTLKPEDVELKSAIRSYASNKKDIARLSKEYFPEELKEQNILAVAATQRMISAPILNTTTWSADEHSAGLKPVDFAFYVLADEGYIMPEFVGVRMLRLGYGDHPRFEQEKKRLMAAFDKFNSATNLEDKRDAKREIITTTTDSLQVAYSQNIHATGFGSGELQIKVPVGEAVAEPTMDPWGPGESRDAPGQPVTFGEPGYSRFYNLQRFVAPVPMSTFRKRLSTMPGGLAWIENGVILLPVTDQAFRQNQKRKSESAKKIDSAFQHDPAALKLLMQATEKHLLGAANFEQLMGVNKAYIDRVRLFLNDENMMPILHELSVDQVVNEMNALPEGVTPEMAQRTMENGRIVFAKRWPDAATDALLWKTEGLNPYDANIIKYLTLQRIVNSIEGSDDATGHNLWVKGRNQLWNLGELGWGIYHGLKGILNGTKWLAGHNLEHGANLASWNAQAMLKQISGEDLTSSDLRKIDNEWETFKDGYSLTGDLIKHAGLTYFNYWKGYADPSLAWRRFSYDSAGVILDFMTPLDLAQLSLKTVTGVAQVALWTRRANHLAKLRHVSIIAKNRGVPKALLPSVKKRKTFMEIGGEKMKGPTVFELDSPLDGTRAVDIYKNAKPSEIPQLRENLHKALLHYPKQAGESVEIILKTSKQLESISKSNLDKIARYPLWTKLLKTGTAWYTKKASQPGTMNYLLSRVVSAEQHGGENVAYLVEHTRATPNVIRQQNARVANSVINEIANSGKYGDDGFEQVLNIFRDFGEAISEMERLKEEGLPMSLSIILEKVPKEKIRRLSITFKYNDETGHYWTVVDNITGEEFGKFNGRSSAEVALADPDAMSKYGLPKGIHVDDDILVGTAPKLQVLHADEPTPSAIGIRGRPGLAKPEQVQARIDALKNRRLDYEKRGPQGASMIEAIDSEINELSKILTEEYKIGKYKLIETDTQKEIGVFESLADAREAQEAEMFRLGETEPIAHHISGADWSDAVGGKDAAMRVARAVAAVRNGERLTPDIINITVKDLYGNDVILDAADLGIVRPMGNLWEFTPVAEQLFLKDGSAWSELSVVAYEQTHAYEKLKQIHKLVEENPVDGLVVNNQVDIADGALRGVLDPEGVLERGGPDIGLGARVEPERINYDKIYLHSEAETMKLAAGEDPAQLERNLYNHVFTNIAKSIVRRLRTKDPQKIADFYGQIGNVNIVVKQDLDMVWAVENQATAKVIPPKTKDDPYVIHILSKKKTATVAEFNAGKGGDAVAFIPDQNYHIAALRNAIEDVFLHKFSPESQTYRMRGEPGVILSEMTTSPLSGERVKLKLDEMVASGDSTKSQVIGLNKLKKQLADKDHELYGYSIVGEPFLEVERGERTGNLQVIISKKTGIKTRDPVEKLRARDEDLIGGMEYPKPLGGERTGPEIVENIFIDRRGKMTQRVGRIPQRSVIYPGGKLNKTHGIALRDSIETNEFFQSIKNGDITLSQARDIINSSDTLRRVPARVPPVYSGSRFLWRKRYAVDPSHNRFSVEVSRQNLLDFIDTLEAHSEAFFLQPEGQLLPDPDIVGMRKIPTLEKPAYLMLPEEYSHLVKKSLGDKALEYRTVIKRALEEGIYKDAVMYNEKLNGSLIDRETAIAIIQSAGLEVPAYLGIDVQALKFDGVLNVDAGFLADVQKQVIHGETTFGAKTVNPNIGLTKLGSKMGLDTTEAVVFLDNVRVDGGSFEGRPEVIQEFLTKVFEGSEITFRKKNLHARHRNGGEQYGKSVLNSESMDKHGISLVYKDGELLTKKAYNDAVSEYISKNDVSNVLVEVLGDWRRNADIMDLRQDPLGRLLLGDNLEVNKRVVEQSFSSLNASISDKAHAIAGNLDPINLAKNAVSNLSDEALAAWTIYMRSGELPPLSDEHMLAAWHDAGLIERTLPGQTPKSTELGVIANLYQISKRWEYYESIIHRAFMGRMKGGTSPNLRMDWTKVIDSMPEATMAQRASKEGIRAIMDDWKYNATIDDLYLLVQEDILAHMVAGGFNSSEKINATMNAFSYIKGIWESSLKENAKVASGHTSGVRGPALKESTAGLTADETLLVEAAKGHFNLGADPFTLFGFTRGEMKSRMGAIEIIEELIKEGLARYGKAVVKAVDPEDIAGARIAPGYATGEYVKFDLEKFFGPQNLTPELRNRYEGLYISNQAAEMLDAGAEAARSWHDLNQKTLSLANPVGFILDQATNKAQIAFRFGQIFKGKFSGGRTFVDELSFLQLNVEQAKRLKESFGKGFDAFKEAWDSMNLNSKAKLPELLKATEYWARTLNSADFMQRYKQYVLFWGPITGAAKNAMGNTLQAVANHPEAFMSASYYEGMRLYFGVDKENLGIMELMGAFKNRVAEEGLGQALKGVTKEGVKAGLVEAVKGTAQTLVGTAKTATGQRGLAKGEIFKFLGDPDVEGTAGWLADQLIARNVLAIGVSGDWELAGPGSVLLGTQEKTLLLTETIRKIVVPQIEAGLKRIELGKARFSAEQRAQILGQHVSIGFAEMRNNAKFMDDLTQSVIEDLRKGGITERDIKDTIAILGHKLNRLDKAVMELPHALILRPWSEINKGLFIVTDDAFKFSYAYFLMKELGMNIDEIVEQIGRSYADYARNSPATHIATGFLPWAKYPIKQTTAFIWGRLKHPLYTNILAKMIAPYQRASDFTSDPSELVAFSMMSPPDRGFLKRSDVGWLNAGWAYDLNPTRAHANIVYNHPLYQLHTPFSIVFNDEWIDQYGRSNVGLNANIDPNSPYGVMNWIFSKVALAQAVRMDQMGQRMGLKSGELALRGFRNAFGPSDPFEGAPKANWGTSLHLPGGKTLEQFQSALFGTDIRTGYYPEEEPRTYTGRDFYNLSLLGMNFGVPLTERFLRNQKASLRPRDTARKLSRGFFQYDPSSFQGTQKRIDAITRAVQQQGATYSPELGPIGSNLTIMGSMEPAVALGSGAGGLRALPVWEALQQKYRNLLLPEGDTQLQQMWPMVEPRRGGGGLDLGGLGLEDLAPFIPKKE